MTQRQREIVRMMTMGQRPKEIARALGISRWTVQTHVRNAKARTEIGETLRLVAISAVEFEREHT